MLSGMRFGMQNYGRTYRVFHIFMLCKKVVILVFCKKTYSGATYGALRPLPGPPFGSTGPAGCLRFEIFRLIFEKVAIFMFYKQVVVGPNIVLSGMRFGVQNYASYYRAFHIFMFCKKVVIFVFCKET